MYYKTLNYHIVHYLNYMLRYWNVHNIGINPYILYSIFLQAVIQLKFYLKLNKMCHACWSGVTNQNEAEIYRHIMKNEINLGLRPLLCTYRVNWARRISWGGDMSEMTLPFRHRIRNSSPGGLRPSTLPLGHESSPQYFYEFTSGWGINIFVFLKLPRLGNESRTLAWNQRC